MDRDVQSPTGIHADDAETASTTVNTKDWFRDDVPFVKKERVAIRSSSQAVRSFWLGCIGLAILCHLTLAASSVGLVFLTAGFQILYWELLGGRVAWLITELHFRTLTNALVPSIVLVAMVPLLLWRGSLASRTAIAMLLALSSLAMIVGWLNHLQPPREWFVHAGGLAFVVACWAAVPIVACWSRLRRSSLLQFALFTALATAVVCVNLSLMVRFPSSYWSIAWVACLVCSFAWTLGTRTWTQSATLEATAEQESIQRTSSRTLLELMAISAIGLAGIASFPTLVSLAGWPAWLYFPWYFVVFIAVANAIAVTEFATQWIHSTLNCNRWTWFVRVRWFVLLDMVVGGVGWADCLANVAAPKGLLTPIQLSLNALVSGTLTAAIVVAFASLCGNWLKFCRWRML